MTHSSTEDPASDVPQASIEAGEWKSEVASPRDPSPSEGAAIPVSTVPRTDPTSSAQEPGRDDEALAVDAGDIELAELESREIELLDGELDRPSTSAAEHRAEAYRLLQKRFAPGTIVGGKFKVERMIARGGMGCVFVGEQVPLGRTIALKVVVPLPGDLEFRRRFLLEASSAGRLNHRNIVTVHDYGETDTQDLYMAMEFLEGVTLGATLARDGQIAPRRTCSIADQVGRALRAAHRAGVVHRDLKPANVMLVHDDEATNRELVKVLDFGLAKLHERRLGPSDEGDLTRAGFMVGSPRFMAPEQIMCGSIDPRTDIYSLGAILFNMLTGRAPFESKDSSRILQGHLQEAAPGADAYPELARSPTLGRLVAACLAKNPEHRPQSMDEVLESLDLAQSELRREAWSRPGSVPPLPTAMVGPVHDPSLHARYPTPVALAPPSSGMELAPMRPRRRFLAAGLLLTLLGATAGVVGAFIWGAEVQPGPVQVTLTSSPAGAVVRLDGALLGRTPLDLALPRREEGSRPSTFRFEANGYVPLVLEGRLDIDHLQLHAGLEAQPAPEPTPVPAPEPPPRQPEPPPRQPEAPPEPRRPTTRQPRSPARPRAVEPAPAPRPAPRVEPASPKRRVPVLTPEPERRRVPIMD